MLKKKNPIYLCSHNSSIEKETLPVKGTHAGHNIFHDITKMYETYFPSYVVVSPYMTEFVGSFWGMRCL